jgi:hypothetical protein
MERRMKWRRKALMVARCLALGWKGVILRGSARPYSARIFLNWLPSKEGQIAQYALAYITPVHKDLMRREFIPFSEQVLGKQTSFRDPLMEVEIVPPMEDYWNKLWMSSGAENSEEKHQREVSWPTVI